MSKPTLEEIVSLAKRRGFIFPSSEIYGGLAGVYDYGPLGVMLKHNIQNLWWSSFVLSADDIYPLDSAILMNSKVWEASGHVAGFSDPMIECSNCHSRFREDHVDVSKPCPVCGQKDTYGKPRQFNMMFKTQVGPTWMGWEADDGNYLGYSEVQPTNDKNQQLTKFLIPGDRKFSALIAYDKNSTSYLRPETAQGIFVNYKNVVDTFSPGIPFGIAQIGKAFRNEISPRDFIFRLRELEQMELQFFINSKDQESAYEDWRQGAWDFLTKNLKIDEKLLRWHEHGKDERAHYAAAAHDIEFDFPFGFKELWGTHNRTDYDLKAHQQASGKNLMYQPKDGGEPFVPYVIESSVGLDRLVLAVLSSAYTEDEVNGEKRTFLKLPENLAPYKVAVCPLAKNKPELVEKAREVYKNLKEEVGNVLWVDTGNIGKNYRRADEIGVPKFITVDFDTLEDGTVTVRDRDTTKQDRVKPDKLIAILE